MGGPVDEVKCPECGEWDWTNVMYGRGCGPVGLNMDPCHIDGWSEARCNNCGTRIGRWTRRILADDEHEPPYGGRHREGCPFYEPDDGQT
jgi:hypothetical protein